MSYLFKGVIEPLKMFCGDCEKQLIEIDDVCYVVIHPSGEYRREGILYPIVGSIDDYEGKEISIEELR